MEHRKVLHCRFKDRLLFKGLKESGWDGSVLSVSPHESGLTIVDESFFAGQEYRECYGIVGIIKLKYNRYVILIEESEACGEIMGQKIWKVKKVSVIPVKKTVRMDAEESQYVSLLEMHLGSATLYFSYGYDLTNSLQRNEEKSDSSGPGYDWRGCDTRFFWNYQVSLGLQPSEMAGGSVNYFVLPLIYGYCKMEKVTFEGSEIEVGLITRRSRLRAGTRYFRRGIDEEGNVANFNETEQIFYEKNRRNMFSFLQTRGSVPIYWSEVNNLKYRPSLMIGENGSLDAFTKHFDEQKNIYGTNYLVNLVNQKGYELPIKESYESAVNALNDPNIVYTYFDFHHECSKMKWHRVKLLIDQLLKSGWDSNDYFHKVLAPEGWKTAQVVRKQSSVIRTNCMDCLDRTNVVQSVLANYILQNQFEKCSLVANGKSWNTDLRLVSCFRNMWADNADAVSNAYSGTGALKTDFTRTGRRTRKGALQDFINSVSRYYQNNFTDGPRQDAYDLFLGNFKPYEVALQSPFMDRRPVLIQLAPTVIYAAFTVIIATIFFPKEHFASPKNLSFFFGSTLVAFAAAKFIISNGMQYVNWPKFCDLGFLVAVHTHNKEQVFKGLTYTPSTNYVNPNILKRD